MLTSLLSEINSRETTFLILLQCVPAVLAVCVWLIARVRKRAGSAVPRIGIDPNGYFNLPRARNFFLHNGRQLVEEGYAKYKDSKYIVQTADMERIIISNKYLDELRNLPSTTLDHVAAQCDRHLAWWTTLDVVKHSSLHADVCRYQLNQHLGPVVMNMAEESRYGIQTQIIEQLVEGKDFTYLTAFPLAMGIASQTVNRVLVGLPLCRNKTWPQTTINFAMNAFAISTALRPRSILTRPFVYWFLDARKKLKEARNQANELLIPVIEQVRQDDVNESERYTMLYWMTQAAKGPDKEPKELVHKALFLSLASIQSSVLAITNFVYDICAFPEYVEPLRQEIKEALKQNGGWNVAALYSMQKLDSFLKESQRINHPGLFSFNRKVLKTVKLSDNTILPAGSFISAPTYSLARDEQYFEDPLTFKPFRFYEMRQKDPKNANRNQFAGTSPNNLSWGYGKNACPGRSFAATEIKLICAQLVHLFDMKFPEGQTERPENVYIDERITPSKTQEVGFRLRNLT